VDDTPAVLQHLPMLASLPHDTKKLVLDSFVPVTYGFGTPIVREGEEAEAWYVLVSGRARVVKQASDGTEMTLGVLRSGDSFGEMGLLACGTRTATVRASSEVQVLKLDKSLFQAILRTHAEIRTSFELQSARRSLHNFLRLYTPFAQLSAALVSGK
jgi:CRP-like cAMP-binding protein